VLESATFVRCRGASRVADTRCALSIARPFSQEIPSRTVPTLQDPIKDPGCFPWNDVTQVTHYYMSVDAMTQPMQVREESPPYSKRGKFQGDDV
jgi:hypothetical protein